MNSTVPSECDGLHEGLSITEERLAEIPGKVDAVASGLMRPVLYLYGINMGV
jgi:hypothetical protein